MTGLSGALLLIIWTVDSLVRVDVSLSIFYLLPISIMTWFMGERVGILMSLLCTLAWLQVDITTKQYDVLILPFWNAVVRLGFFAITSYLLASLREAYQREQSLARIDGLTGVYNRRYFLELLQLELRRNSRTPSPLTLAYLDLDNFKLVNDKFGHSAGDDILRAVARCLRETLRCGDLVGRIGGDEFAILLPQMQYQQAKTALMRVHQQLQLLSQSQGWPVGFSIGAITFVTPPDSVDMLIAQSDQLMYLVKGSGKNRVEMREYAA